ncbi:hypothetical protein NPIL_696151 [Nephila pilipes]|uniref:Uncharacterized protein n=1 Tax=Nephila pilipes TaxID=299642 RepID=A0A8X6MI74_NEPPI|nr:hypothetical protein NPIL_696151 [Nephila pilipes]
MKVLFIPHHTFILGRIIEVRPHHADLNLLSVSTYYNESTRNVLRLSIELVKASCYQRPLERGIHSQDQTVFGDDLFAKYERVESGAKKYGEQSAEFCGP